MKHLLRELRACLYGKPFFVEKKRTRMLQRLKYMQEQDMTAMSFTLLRSTLRGAE